MTLAYLDPGSGSLIASALVGGVAAAGVAARQARAKLGGFGRKKKGDDEPTPAVADESAPAQAQATTQATTTDAGDEPTTVSSDT